MCVCRAVGLVDCSVGSGVKAVGGPGSTEWGGAGGVQGDKR